jgi:LEA14-like dessication related protein
MGIGLDVTVRVYNPNSFDVRVREVRVATTLADRIQMPWMKLQPNQWLPAKQTVAVVVPTVIPWPLVPQLLAASMGTEDISYHVVGEADVAATRAFGIHVNHEKVDERGKVPRSMILSAARTMIPGAR